tara:strand:+ start:627 stop:1667 length:1041 start_codon:yes stop_codon:yes gene_type:complete
VVKIKIVLFTHVSTEFPLTEGLRKEVWLTAKELFKEGHNVEIRSFIPDKYNPFKKKTECIKEGIKIIRGTIFNMCCFKTEILHIFSHPCPDIYPVINFAKYTKCFLTITDGELCRFWKGKLAPIISSMINKKVNSIFLQTDYQKKIADKYLKCKTVVIPPIIPIFSQTKKKSKTPSILFMSHLIKHKGIYEVLNAFKELREEQKINLIIADSKITKDTKKVYEYISRIGTKNIYLKKVVNPETELSNAWIYLYYFNSANNTFSLPLSLFESIQTNTPFISSDVGGMNEYFNSDFLIKPGNYKLLKKKIKELIKDYSKLNAGKILLKPVNNKDITKQLIKEYASASS